MKNSRKGEIVTILTFATLVVIGLSTIVSTLFLQSSKNKIATNSRAEEGVWNCPGGQCNMCGKDGPWGRTGGCGTSPDAPPGVKPGWRPPAECGGSEFQCSPPNQGSCGNDGCVNNNPKAPYGLRGGYELIPTAAPPPKPAVNNTPTPASDVIVLPGNNDAFCIQRGCEKAPCSVVYDKASNAVVKVNCTPAALTVQPTLNPGGWHWYLVKDTGWSCIWNNTPGVDCQAGETRPLNNPPVPTSTPAPIAAPRVTPPASVLPPCGTGFICGTNPDGSCVSGYSEKCLDVSGVRPCCKRVGVPTVISTAAPTVPASALPPCGIRPDCQTSSTGSITTCEDAHPYKCADGTGNIGCCKTSTAAPTVIPTAAQPPATAAVIPEARDYVCDFDNTHLASSPLGKDYAPAGSASNCKQVVPKADGSGGFMLQGYEYHPGVAQMACSSGWFGTLVNCYIIHI